MKKYLIIFAWLLSLIITTVHFNENPELVEKIKEYFKNDMKMTTMQPQQEDGIYRTPGNSFLVEVSEELSFSEKTAFVIHDT